MSRGDPDHVSNAARELLSSEAHRELRQRMDEAMRVRLRGVDPRDAEACRVIVIQIQEHEAYFSGIEKMARELDVRDKRAIQEVV